MTEEKEGLLQHYRQTREEVLSATEGLSATRAVNQASYSDAWVSLGTYRFAGTSGDYVYASNVTGTCCTQTVGIDAVEFVPKSQ